MSRMGKTFLFISALALVVLMSARYLLEGWHTFMFAPLGIFLGCLVLTIVVDFRLLVDFLTMRTTKHGMNMGAMILMGIVLMVSVNYLSVRFNKSKDFTEERLNSLSMQSLDVLKALKGQIQIVVFYKGEDAKDQRNQIKAALELYREADPELKVTFYNSYVENFKAQEYLNGLPDKQQGMVFMFAEYKGKKIRIDSPFSEEQITQAFIKASHASKTVYFVQGHGERDLDSTEVEGLSDFKKDLEADAMKVEKLNLMEKGAVPDNADVVAIVGSVSQFLASELEALRNYAAKGGRLFIAVDPGQKHNLAGFTKSLGVEYMNNYIISNSINNKLLGKGAVSAMGLKFDSSNEITRRFRTGQNYAIFDLASEVKPVASLDPGLKATQFIQTDGSNLTLTELKQPKGPVDMRSVTIGIQVKGSLGKKPEDNGGEEGKAKEFAMVVYGDSDFVTNRGINEGLNKDLALNTMATLADQGDLVSIRPPQPKGTKLNMTHVTGFIVFICCALLPLLLLLSSSIVWFRRRSA